MSEQQFLILNDRESDPYRGFTQVVLASSGNHVATSFQGQVTLDQKLIQFPGKDPRLGNAMGLSFSPDGTRLAGMLRDSAGIGIFVDGAVLPGYGAANDGQISDIQNHAYTWSPDSKHVAFFCRSSNPAAATDVYVCMDGSAFHLGAGGSYANLTFSADSNHLFWTVRRPGYGIRVFADGSPVFEGNSTNPGGMIAGTWEAGPGSSLLLLTQDQAGLRGCRLRQQREPASQQCLQENRQDSGLLNFSRAPKLLLFNFGGPARKKGRCGAESPAFAPLFPVC